jgi:tetratricopeptide (TPR) repeat protein
MTFGSLVSFLPWRQKRLAPGLFLSLCGTLFLAAGSPPAQAQMGGIDTDPGDRGTGGRSQIQGTVYYPGGRRLDRRVKVRLRSIAAAEQFTLTDDSGAFTFRRLKGGSYTVVIEAGDDFELAVENVDIIEGPARRNDTGMVATVQVNLQRKLREAKPVGTVTAIPEEALKLYGEALQSSKAGDNKKAVEQLNSALKIFPQYLAALNELGVQYMRMKQYDRAEESFKSAMKIAPDAFTPRLNYGVLLVHTRNYPKAVDELYKALQKNPSSPTGLLYIGRALVSLGSYDDAEKFLVLAVNVATEAMEKAETHRYLGAVYIEKKDYSKAVRELETYLTLAPDARDAKAIADIIKQLHSRAPSK